MHRILLTATLLALAPACVHAQDAASPARAEPAAARKSHNPFGAAMLELTRAAREQAAATPAKAASNAASAPATPAAAKAPAGPARPATAAVLAASRNP